MKIPYIKMAGLGNDFVIFDARSFQMPVLNFAKIADREAGIGCDQIIILQPSAKADVTMRIINADGSEVEACGNATRCVGWLLGKPHSHIETLAGILKTRIIGDEVQVDMGVPQFANRILPIEGEPVEVSIGNPHLVFFKNEIESLDLEAFGKPLEHHAAFPNRTNVEVVQVQSRSHLIMRVWERGAGITQACGTGACAAAAAAIKRGLADNMVKVSMSGGSLQIEWQGGASSLLMQGAVSLTFRSELDVEHFKA